MLRMVSSVSRYSVAAASVTAGFAAFVVWRWCRRAHRASLHRLRSLVEHGEHFAGTIGTRFYAGVYPRGFADIALAELEMVGAVTMPGGHLIDHAVVIFQVDNVKSTIIDLGAFSCVFEVFNEPRCLSWPLQADELEMALAEEVITHTTKWLNAITCRWRATCVRKAIADAPETLRSPVVERALAKAVGQCLPGAKDMEPPVDLKGYKIEAIAFLSDGVDTVAQARSATGPTLRPAQALLLLGVRGREHCQVGLAALGATKGSKVLSRADDAVAFCIAYRAATTLGYSMQRVKDVQAVASPSIAANRQMEIVVADPMCGVGTYLFALRWVLLQHFLAPHCDHHSADKDRIIKLIGSDAEASAIQQANENLLVHEASLVSETNREWPKLDLSFVFENTSEWASRMQASGGIDLILVDPPWGQRHSSFSKVMQSMNSWARDWAKALRPGGRALVVTIRTKQFEREVISNLEHRKLLFLEEAVQFDNKGYGQCKLYILRKPTS